MSHLTPAKPYLDFNLADAFDVSRVTSIVLGAVWQCVDSALPNYRGTIWMIESLKRSRGRFVEIGLKHLPDAGGSVLPPAMSSQERLLAGYQYVGGLAKEEEPVELEVALRLGEEAFG